MMFYFVIWRTPEAARPAFEQIVLRENPASQKEVKVMAQTAAEHLMEQGAARQLRRMLRSRLTSKFGELPQGLSQQIEAAQDIERLEAAFNRSLTAEKL